MRKQMLSLSILTLALAVILTAVGLPAPADAQIGPPGGTIYAHDEMYQTVATPSKLPNHGKFNTIYVLNNGLASVADAAPGDHDYRGGRWEVHMVAFTNIAPTQYTNAEDLRAAAENGDITIGDVVKRFVCPMIKKH